MGQCIIPLPPRRVGIGFEHSHVVGCTALCLPGVPIWDPVEQQKCHWNGAAAQRTAVAVDAPDVNWNPKAPPAEFMPNTKLVLPELDLSPTEVILLAGLAER